MTNNNSLWKYESIEKNHFIAGSARRQKTIKMFTFVRDLECNCNNKTRQKELFSLLRGTEKKVPFHARQN